MPLETSVCAPWVDSDELTCGVAGERAAAVDIASDVLFQLSGRQFSGECTATVRPCRQRPGADAHRSSSYWGDLGYQHSWGDCGCSSQDECGCGTLSQVDLGGYPVASITTVKVDGAIVLGSAYRVDEHRFLVRVDGDGWPCCQDLSEADTEVGTFSVTFKYGVAPPPSGVNAAEKLACSLLTSGSDDCELPERIQTVTRQGLTQVIIDPQSFLQDGKVGIYEVDLFLAAFNPEGLRQPAAVLSPDFANPVRRVGQ